jgi:hypothetical protein
MHAAPDRAITATGGARFGLDAARALALGATLIGMGFPFLKAAAESESAVREFLEQSLAKLRVATRLPSAAHECLELPGFERTWRAMARRGMRDQAASAAHSEQCERLELSASSVARMQAQRSKLMSLAPGRYRRVFRGIEPGVAT